SSDAPYKSSPVFTQNPDTALLQLTTAANFVEVWLAKEGHSGVVGVNYLEKIQLPHLSSLYGALLAGVDYVIMGAGIPRQIPEVLDRLVKHEEAQYRLHVEGAEVTFTTTFNPQKILGRLSTPLRRPRFLPIVSSATLAVAMARKAHGGIDGFVVEGALAGGHNAPPRDPEPRNERGEPVYGPADEVDFTRIRELGLPFWIAGSWAEPSKLRVAEMLGAAGIQVGTAFAFCQESGMDPELRERILKQVRDHQVDVFTDPRASPAGFPFKVASVPGTVSEKGCYEERERVCDIGLLRSFFPRPDGSLGYRCPAEPERVYLAKGGAPEDLADRKCICNGLLATAGLAQRRATGYVEPPIVTAGDDLAHLDRFLQAGTLRYSAKDVIDQLLAPLPHVP
ncbi:MAG TPA: nitronate monooxygenase, partial [Elusimicrobiota bacterium]|nr:nitronate monooxygenase [Elusimicrobiota bacterium]